MAMFLDSSHTTDEAPKADICTYTHIMCIHAHTRTRMERLGIIGVHRKVIPISQRNARQKSFHICRSLSIISFPFPLISSLNVSRFPLPTPTRFSQALYQGLPTIIPMTPPYIPNHHILQDNHTPAAPLVHPYYKAQTPSSPPTSS